mmetsp:Transcript_81444/g.136324  ORF Transcript_81444/g.136324 Transcript_81444/m.136324 type:complete len:227 (+) Transcript_81444:1887-2567(+)
MELHEQVRDDGQLAHADQAPGAGAGVELAQPPGRRDDGRLDGGRRQGRQGAVPRGAGVFAVTEQHGLAEAEVAPDQGLLLGLGHPLLEPVGHFVEPVVGDQPLELPGLSLGHHDGAHRAVVDGQLVTEILKVHQQQPVLLGPLLVLADAAQVGQIDPLVHGGQVLVAGRALHDVREGQHAPGLEQPRALRDGLLALLRPGGVQEAVLGQDGVEGAALLAGVREGPL